MLKKLPAKDKRLNFWEWPAYLIDLYRVFPRLMFIIGTYFVGKLGFWYMFTLVAVERTAEVSAFVSIVFAAWVKMLDYYMQRGNDWSKRMQLNGGESGGSSVS
jgi:hypothetical protein